jgi:collagenase-like PrtC family protease
MYYLQIDHEFDIYLRSIHDDLQQWSLILRTKRSTRRQTLQENLLHEGLESLRISPRVCHADAVAVMHNAFKAMFQSLGWIELLSKGRE